MPRLSLLALAVLITAGPAAAQSQPDDESGTYVMLQDVDLTVEDGDLLGYGVVGEVGRRFGGGLEAGLLASYGSYRSGSVQSAGWRLGLTSGLAHAAPLGTTLRFRGLASVGASHATSLEANDFRATTLLGDLSATLGRSIPIIGSLRLEPSVGAYTQANQTLGARGTGHFEGLPASRTRLGAGLQVELPVRFRVFGADASVTTGLRRALLGNRAAGIGLVPGTGLRFDF